MKIGRLFRQIMGTRDDANPGKELSKNLNAQKTVQLLETLWQLNRENLAKKQLARRLMRINACQGIATAILSKMGMLTNLNKLVEAMHQAHERKTSKSSKKKKKKSDSTATEPNEIDLV